MKLKITPNLRTFLAATDIARIEDKESRTELEFILKDSSVETIEWQTLRKAYLCAKCHGVGPQSEQQMEIVAEASVALSQLIKGSGIVHEKLPERKRSPELEAKLAEIRQNQANEEYLRMISTATYKKELLRLGFFDPGELKGLSSQVATIFNVLFSVAALFVFVMICFENIITEIGLRTLLALISSLLLAGVECTLILIHLDRDDKCLEHERAENRKASHSVPVPSAAIKQKEE